MRIICSFFVVLILSGCGAAGILYHRNYYKSTLIISEDKSTSWEIIAPDLNEWRTTSIIKGAPEYFLQKKVINHMLYSDMYNFFFAKYKSENFDFDLFVRIVGALQMKKGEAVNIVDGRYSDIVQANSEQCENSFGIGVEVSARNVNLNFNTNDVLFVKNGEKIYGNLISLSEGYLRRDTVYLQHGTYNLEDPQTIAQMQHRASRKDPRPYPTFGFKFPMSCRDIENSVLVIGGFTYKGKDLPPLRVRLRYEDLSKVPEYMGPQTER